MNLGLFFLFLYTLNFRKLQTKTKIYFLLYILRFFEKKNMENKWQIYIFNNNWCVCVIIDQIFSNIRGEQ